VVVSKEVVYRAYVDMCRREGLQTTLPRPVMGKMVKRLFPQVRTVRRGPRGQVRQYYVGLRRREDVGRARAVTVSAPVTNRSGATSQKKPELVSSLSP
jgi:hypothetical protein